MKPDASGANFFSNMEGTDEISAGIPSGKSLDSRATTPTGEGATGTTVSTGIWIDAIYVPRDVATGNNAVAYFDFYIKACWTPLGGLPDSRTLTIVRIYDDF
jgi:hypothetical protein